MKGNLAPSELPCVLLECFYPFRVVDMDVARGMVIIKNPNSTDSNLRDFTFDAVYDWK